MTESEKRRGSEPGSWDLLEDLYYQGKDLDEVGRSKLLASLDIKNPSLIRELEALWAYKPRNKSIFESLPHIARGFWQSFAGEVVPDKIGVYEIIEELGFGGMGVVYKAKQPPPLNREVAIKVLPAALTAWAWRVRFEREQRSLSRMSHVNIATVHDAGVTEGGQPFLVMELLDGQPISSYCDEKKLSIADRIDLFIQVCEGVNHAHRKGIIHRDLKPSNVLIIERDGVALPKIIDFGIADSTDINESEGIHGVFGTPAYMSPEQAAQQSTDVDTRSDIYALGSMFFELLCGKTPLEKQLKAAESVVERCRLIREIMPEPLGLQSHHVVNKSIALVRQTTPRKLKRQLSGELDWITTKALQRDPNARYGSCSELVGDLRRFKENKPVSVGDNRAWYALGKWLTNHKWFMASTFTIFSSLLIALIGTLTALAAERRSENIHSFWKNVFGSISPYDKGRDVKAFEILDDAVADLEIHYEGKPENEREIRVAVVKPYMDLGEHEKAESHFARIAEIDQVLEQQADEEALRMVAERAYNLSVMGKGARAVDLFKDALSLAVTHHGSNHRVTLKLQNGYATALSRLGMFKESLKLYEATLRIQREVLGSGHQETLATTTNMGDLLVKMRLFEEAESLFEESLKNLSPGGHLENPFVATLKHNLALTYLKQKRFPEAIVLGKEVLARRQEMLGPHHPDTLSSGNNLATAIGESQGEKEAIALLKGILVVIPEKYAGRHEPLRVKHNLGHFLKLAGNYGEAIEVLNETHQGRQVLLGADHPNTLITHYTLGEALYKSGDTELGRMTLLEAISISERVRPEGPVTMLLRQDFRRHYEADE